MKSFNRFRIWNKKWEAVIIVAVILVVCVAATLCFFYDVTLWRLPKPSLIGMVWTWVLGIFGIYGLYRWDNLKDSSGNRPSLWAALMCAVGLHQWKHGCKCTVCSKQRDKDHNWNGCRCTICGTVRDEGHNWNGCKCTICGTVRDEGHNWNGCKCTICGIVRDEGHDLIGCYCSICRRAFHHYENYVCVKCGSVAQHTHVWVDGMCELCHKKCTHPRGKRISSIGTGEEDYTTYGSGVYEHMIHTYECSVCGCTYDIYD